ncbi:unnamed protein product [Vitrella brassicaformis CCMP3155]|uniref:Uncharacterized protein n=3 Tax=Vitrella brassicaformis TaxID=1169539 RepID=A0A0G4F9L6_VITBC|nr:unnamed protein product [Vitrella brassicaformis CCMP3155]|eukprot:CEM09645.1 unnamed protein product [Vitrella brassicaformis CCMP3155]
MAFAPSRRQEAVPAPPLYIYPPYGYPQQYPLRELTAQQVVSLRTDQWQPYTSSERPRLATQGSASSSEIPLHSRFTIIELPGDQSGRFVIQTDGRFHDIQSDSALRPRRATSKRPTRHRASPQSRRVHLPVREMDAMATAPAAAGASDEDLHGTVSDDQPQAATHPQRPKRVKRVLIVRKKAKHRTHDGNGRPAGGEREAGRHRITEWTQQGPTEAGESISFRGQIPFAPSQQEAHYARSSVPLYKSSFLQPPHHRFPSPAYRHSHSDMSLTTSHPPPPSFFKKAMTDGLSPPFPLWEGEREGDGQPGQAAAAAGESEAARPGSQTEGGGKRPASLFELCSKRQPVQRSKSAELGRGRQDANRCLQSCGIGGPLVAKQQLMQPSSGTTPFVTPLERSPRELAPSYTFDTAGAAPPVTVTPVFYSPQTVPRFVSTTPPPSVPLARPTRARPSDQHRVDWGCASYTTSRGGVPVSLPSSPRRAFYMPQQQPVRPVKETPRFSTRGVSREDRPAGELRATYGRQGAERPTFYYSADDIQARSITESQAQRASFMTAVSEAPIRDRPSVSPSMVRRGFLPSPPPPKVPSDQRADSMVTAQSTKLSSAYQTPAGAATPARKTIGGPAPRRDDTLDHYNPPNEPRSASLTVRAPVRYSLPEGSLTAPVRVPTFQGPTFQSSATVTPARYLGVSASTPMIDETLSKEGYAVYYRMSGPQASTAVPPTSAGYRTPYEPWSSRQSLAPPSAPRLSTVGAVSMFRGGGGGGEDDAYTGGGPLLAYGNVPSQPHPAAYLLEVMLRLAARRLWFASERIKLEMMLEAFQTWAFSVKYGEIIRVWEMEVRASEDAVRREDDRLEEEEQHLMAKWAQKRQEISRRSIDYETLLKQLDATYMERLSQLRDTYESRRDNIRQKAEEAKAQRQMALGTAHLTKAMGRMVSERKLKSLLQWRSQALQSEVQAAVDNFLKPYIVPLIKPSRFSVMDDLPESYATLSSSLPMHTQPPFDVSQLINTARLTLMSEERLRTAVGRVVQQKRRTALKLQEITYRKEVGTLLLRSTLRSVLTRRLSQAFDCLKHYIYAARTLSPQMLQLTLQMSRLAVTKGDALVFTPYDEHPTEEWQRTAVSTLRQTPGGEGRVDDHVEDDAAAIARFLKEAETSHGAPAPPMLGSASTRSHPGERSFAFVSAAVDERRSTDRLETFHSMFSGMDDSPVSVARVKAGPRPEGGGWLARPADDDPVVSPGDGRSRSRSPEKRERSVHEKMA